MVPQKLTPRLLLAVALIATAAFFSSGVSAASASDPDHVNFTLEGCRPNGPITFSGALPFVCPDANYTTGNLGKFWNELDLVPHRLTADTGTNNPGYDVTITADYLNGSCSGLIPPAGQYPLSQVPVTQAMIDAGCVPGYDFITAPTLNAALSTGTCNISFSGPLPFVCPDANYTTGNLGKFWNELDLVPHRLTADTGTNNPGYDVTITADFLNGNCNGLIPPAGQYPLSQVPVTQAMIDAGCVPGYDFITAPTLNTALSTGTCAISFSGPMVLIPGAGGTAASIYREVHITQSAGSHCVFDYDERLALGSHLYPGSSLHSNLLNENFGTAGIGARDVSIPVKEIQPQTLSKTMTATQGQSNTWEVHKSANASNLDFPNVCSTDPANHQQQVEITVAWTKTTTAAGVITVHTVVTANNPAHRALTINVTDKTYKGSGQGAADLVHTEVSGPVSLAPGSHVVLDYSVQYAQGTATMFNDVATATYTDPVLNGQPIGGVTSAATQSAVVQGVGGANASAIISDTEDISGAGLSFSVDSHNPNIGSYSGGYTEGTQTSNPVTWSSGTVSASGSVTFTKTVQVGGSASTTGDLTDQATVFATDGVTVLDVSDNGPGAGDQPLDIPISATGCGSISGSKYSDLNSNGSRDSGEPGLGGWTFYVDSNDNGTLDAGEPSTTSAADGTWTITGIEPGSFKVREVGQPSWICTQPAQSDQNGCFYGPLTFDGTANSTDAVFGNHNTVPRIAIDKSGPATATAGDLLPYTLVVTNPGEESFAAANVVVTDPQCTTVPALQVKNRGAGTDSTPDTLDPGDSWVYTCSGQTQAGQTSFVNQACVQGTDQFGRQVSACDDVTTTLSQQQVLGEQVVPGTARLAGRSGCVARAFYATVRGKQIQQVVFRIDGKKRATVKSPDSKGRFKYLVNPKAFRPGSHLLTARTTFVADSKTNAKTMRLRFARCVRRTAPAFTG